MDSKLDEKLKKWWDHVTELARHERVYLDMEANDKPMFSKMFLEMEAKTVAEREAMVFASDDWMEFTRGKIVAKVDFLKCKRQLELIIASYQAEYLEVKQVGEAVRKPG